ncbi:hypothetical protein LQ327_28540 [Actinomycetospora endophytica]|uniref:Uncharacterized protein n=1 Tax=Actinomycetospora endophytica TaxID=2291215 RepID=A0ABS8PGH3_9PSEU|nr:hypothetical protein [Actinomycetospora endophytica]MCD2197328.1 hypothetical protein [Actinomycetospora endophytica]
MYVYRYRDADPVRSGAAMPLLTAGRHHHTGDGACLLEYVSLLCGERFGDHPRAVDPSLAQLGRLINDALSDQTRPQLTLFAPELIGTRSRSRRDLVQAAVAVTLADAGLLLAPEETLFWRLAAEARRLEHRSSRGPGGRRGARSLIARWGCGPATLASTFQRLRARLPSATPERDEFLLHTMRSAIRSVHACLDGPGESTPTPPAPGPAATAGQLSG